MEEVRNVLWIDDDVLSMALKPYVIELETGGLKVLAASTPEKAFEYLAMYKSKISIVIVDISMPLGESIDFTEAKAGTQTGLVLLKKIADHPLYSSIPLVVFTIVNDQEVKNYSDKNNIPYFRKRREFPNTFLKGIIKALDEKN